MEKVRKRADSVNELHGRTAAKALQWGIGEFNAGVTQEIGAQTTMALIFGGRGRLARRITYSRADQWTRGAAPTVEVIDPSSGPATPRMTKATKSTTVRP